MEEIWTMTPEHCFSIAGRKPRSRRTAENRFNSNSCCQMSSVNASTPPSGAEEPVFVAFSLTVFRCHFPVRQRIVLHTQFTPSWVSFILRQVEGPWLARLALYRCKVVCYRAEHGTR